VPVESHGPEHLVAPDVLCLRVLIANLCFVGRPVGQGRPGGQGDWVLVDAGLTGSADRIAEAAAERFGAGRPPTAIILTHGHFDHVGAVQELADRWQVPVYAHPLELPYLTGQADYPPPDPSVGGGMMSLLSPLYPRSAIDLGARVRPLPADGAVPGLPDWRWIHTPGHTPGHIALFRARDRVLIAGDAFTTVKQESALAVLLQEQEVHGPPAYFTTDWKAAWDSVQHLRDLNPSVVATGHGTPMAGPELARQLAELAEEFDHLAIPDHGRYVPDAATEFGHS
jgi:glyoxylase-like metal-dependent hydrolase (beta-lactamase superfamily II)